MTKPTISLTRHRTASIEVLRPQGENGPVSIRAALSSDTPIRVGPFTEVLRHTREAIDMSRAVKGLPLTVGHSEMVPTSPELPIGRISNITLDNDQRLRGDLEFDSDDRSQAVRGKVERGFAPDISVSYQILNHTKPDKFGRVEVTRWLPTAASIVSVPADPTVGAGRSTEAIRMPEEVKTEATEKASATPVARAIARTEAGFAAGEQAALERFNEIQNVADQICRAHPSLESSMRALAQEARSDASMTADQFRAAALELMSSGVAPLNPEPRGEVQPRQMVVHPPGDARRGLVVPGEDARDKAARGMVLSLCERASTPLTDKENEGLEGNQFRGWSVMDVAAECLELSGRSTRGMSREQIAKAAIGMRAISPGTAFKVTSDFPSVTENVITKRVHFGYDQADVTWSRWCSTFEAPDFKQFTIPRISRHADLPVVLENAAYQPLNQVDEKEAATLVKHGGLFSLSWEAMVNDDMSMFGRTAASMGESAARTVDVKAYAVLTENPQADRQGPTMNDGNQLFDDANHGNLGTAALDLAGIVATRVKMARQTDDNSVPLGIILRHVIVPEELRDTADNLAGSEYIPWVEGATPQTTRINTVRGTFQVTATIRLTDTTDWFAAGAAGGTVEVAFLQGNRNPALERDQGWDTDAIHWKIRHPSVAYPVDWRALQFNKVAGA